MSSDDKDRLADDAREACTRALKQVCLAMPHLSGLVHKLRFGIEPRIGTAAVFASGRMVVNPAFALSLKPAELVFVLAHEVLHLALDTHSRGVGADPEAVNVAHDYIINDILADELGQEVPAGGLDYQGARHYSLEEVLSWGHRLQGQGCWRAPDREPPLSAMAEALVEAGLAERPEHETNPMLGDVLNASLERQWYPDATPAEQARRARDIRSEAAKANSLEIMKEQIERAGRQQGGAEEGDWSQTVEALKTAYRPPWQLALQRWFDAGAPTERTFARPSRRGADRTDIVLPGRRREGRTMHIVLDTSGSMVEELQLALGAIGGFCEANGVEEVHILQCDVTVTVDEWVTADALESYDVRGFGGSDMTPAMDCLAEDPSVEAAIVITDGYIDFPREPVPYEVLWAIIDPWGGDFEPAYGIVVPMPAEELGS